MPQIRQPVQPTALYNLEFAIRKILKNFLKVVYKYVLMLVAFRLGRALLAILSPLSFLIPLVIRQMAIRATLVVLSMLPAIALSGLSFIANLIPVLFVLEIVHRYFYWALSTPEDGRTGAAAGVVLNSVIDPVATTATLAWSAAAGATCAEVVRLVYEGTYNRAAVIGAQELGDYCAEYANDKVYIKTAILTELELHPELTEDVEVVLLLSQNQEGTYKVTMLRMDDENAKRYLFNERIKSPAGIELTDPVTNDPVLAWAQNSLFWLQLIWSDQIAAAFFPMTIAFRNAHDDGFPVSDDDDTPQDIPVTFAQLDRLQNR